LVDVYQGLGPAVERGRVKSLRIMEQVRKTEDIPVTPHVVEFGPRAYDQSPLMSYGTYYAKRCWGEVPVEQDGSAHFRAPALREIYFQACDVEGRELQRMTSAAQLMPGETVGCVGCHEPRASTPLLGKPPLAARREPSVPQQPAWAPDGIIDFVSVVQPVLDRHCVKCHGGERAEGGYDLSGDKTRFFNMAYDNLLGRSRSYRQHRMDTGEMLPEEAAKGKPLVHFFWLLQTPTAVNQPLWTGSCASRLPDYLSEKHCGAPVPAEDRRRVYTWIDADVPYYGTYATSRPRAGGKRDLCADPRTGEPAEWFTKEFMPVYARRCVSCHGEYRVDGRLLTCWDGRTAWLNFTRPQFSAALTAHLARTAGGRGITRTADDKPVPMFADTSDADYQTMLRALETGRQQALATPGPDMPGFKLTRKEP
jgi:mono/diheme cytochrome c family protein